MTNNREIPDGLRNSEFGEILNELIKNNQFETSNISFNQGEFNIDGKLICSDIDTKSNNGIHDIQISGDVKSTQINIKDKQSGNEFNCDFRQISSATKEMTPSSQTATFTTLKNVEQIVNARQEYNNKHKSPSPIPAPTSDYLQKFKTD